MKRFLFAFHFVLFVAMNSARASDNDVQILSIIDDSFSAGAYTRYRITRIDSDGYFRLKPKEVSSGEHQLDYLTCVGDGGNCTRKIVSCTTEPGYIYRVNEKGCFQYERRMDFKGATDYWAKIDAELKAKREVAALAANKAAEEKEANQYQTDKMALEDAKTTSDVDKVITSIELRLKNGVHKDDPDNLLDQASKKRSVFAKTEAVENARIEAERKKEEARLAKDESIRKTVERKHIDDFRKRIAEGSETNCGLVIEVKGQLVKVSYPVANYGNEHWIRRNEIFPSEYGCHFYNGQYQPAQ